MKKIMFVLCFLALSVSFAQAETTQEKKKDLEAQAFGSCIFMAYQQAYQKNDMKAAREIEKVCLSLPGAGKGGRSIFPQTAQNTRK